jgi:hypothetical protein
MECQGSAPHLANPTTAHQTPTAAIVVEEQVNTPADAGQQSAITPREQLLIDEFRELPFGTWVEFVSDDETPARRLKLSWFSPLTGTCMFVDSFGRRAETKPIRSVTAAIMADRAKIIRQSTQPFFDRALSAIQEMLRIPQRPARSDPASSPA